MVTEWDDEGRITKRIVRTPGKEDAMASHEPMEGHRETLPMTPNRGELSKVYATMMAAAEVEPDVTAKMYYNETVQLVAAAFYFDTDPLWVIGILEGLFKQSETVTGYYKALGLSQYYGAWELRGDVIQHTIKLFKELPSVRERGVWAEIGERVEYVDEAEVRGHALFRDVEGRLHRWAVIRTDNPDCLMDGTLHLMSPGRLREERQRRAMPDARCVTTADGGCEGSGCMHDPKPAHGKPRSRRLETEDEPFNVIPELPKGETFPWHTDAEREEIATEYARAMDDHQDDPSPFGAPRLEDFTGEADAAAYNESMADIERMREEDADVTDGEARFPGNSGPEPDPAELDDHWGRGSDSDYIQQPGEPD
jgi:hypothetical protein